MTAITARAARLRWVAVMTVLMLLVGTSAAAAYWTAQVQVSGNASAATVGLTQNLLPAEGNSPLAVTYSDENPTAAGAVSITNTGSREATYALTVRAGAATDPGLAAALQVAAAPVGSDEECSPDTALSDAAAQGLPFEGEIGADATIIVCVQTTLPSADISAFADEQIDLEIASSLEYVEADEWMLQEPAMTVRQHVEADPFGGVEEMTCEGFPPDYLELLFSPPADDMKWRVEYRVFLAHEANPDIRFEFEARDISGYYTSVQVSHDSQDLLEFAKSPDGGLGNTWVHVEQRFDDEQTWTPIAFYQMHVFEAAPEEVGELRMDCGWR